MLVAGTRSARRIHQLPTLIYRISFFSVHFLFPPSAGYGHACLIKGSGIAAKGGHNESDLLHEIDKALRIGRGFLLEQGACAILLHQR
jgi:hypothetical protein